LRRGATRVAGAAAAPQIEQAGRLLQLHDAAGAARICEQVIELNPGLVKAWELLGVAALNLGDYPLAAERFERVLALVGDDPQALANAAEANRRADRCDQALALIGRALARKPGFAPFLHIHVLALESCWRSDEALAACREALRLHPDFAGLHTSYMSLLIRTGADPALILDAHRRWGERFGATRTSNPRHRNPPQAERRLRIGYVSADFRQHAVSNFVLPLLEHHDPALLQVHCYSNTPKTDEITRRCEALASHWRDIVALPDAAAEDLIRSDGIDILIDLSGHTSGNRLGVFARKPAPVQVTYLGYAATTGMSAMDYRVTDAMVDPPGASDGYYTEKLLRLPHSLWCFQPSAAMPEPATAPSLRAGRITFGSLNAMAKLTPRMIALWSRLLLSVPDSRLLIAAVPEGGARERIAAEFACHAVSAQILSFHASMELERFWGLHGEIDIALDAFPYNGATTTCIALWLGVPVVSLAGNLLWSRCGSSLLSGIGLQELVAQSEEEYLLIARRLAQDRARLSQLRQGMRERMLASPLMDAKRFTRDLEGCYRAVWRQWCRQQGQPHA
jgi:protein O-GlcNAc transferase